MADKAILINEASAASGDHEWCAQLMASSDPWITLGRDLTGCRATLARPGTELFLARQPDLQRLGFMMVAPYGLAGSPYIALLAVAEGSRGQGVGSQLLAFAEARFAERRRPIFLLASSFNPRAQNLYRRVGYYQVGELQDYVIPGASELIFRKDLA